jgi:hypothetical protein
VVAQDGLETFRRVIAHDDMAGEQAVADGILRRTPLARGGNRTLGSRPVGSRAQEASK